MAERRSSLPTETSSFKLTDNKLVYLYDKFKKHLKQTHATHMPTKVEFRGLLHMLGITESNKSIEELWEQLLEEWNYVLEIAEEAEAN